jgi:hypothetical protein
MFLLILQNQTAILRQGTKNKLFGAGINLYMTNRKRMDLSPLKYMKALHKQKRNLLLLHYLPARLPEFS